MMTRDGIGAKLGQKYRLVEFFVQRVQFNAQGLPTGRESMLMDLNQRIRDVQPGPDGFLYVITDEAAGAMLKIEPVQ